MYSRPLLPFELTAPVKFGRGILLIYASLAVAGLISCGALVGWLADLPLLTSWGPDFVTMKPVTALAFLLIACAIVPQLALAPRWRIGIGVIAALLGASSLIQEYGGLELGLESWLAPASAAPGPTSVNFLMSPVTAFAVVFAGTATAFLPFPRLADAARFLAAGLGVIGATVLLGYLLGVEALYSFPPYASVALPTAIALISISAALLTHAQSSSPARGGDGRLFLSIFFAPLLIFSLFVWWSWRIVEADARADADRTIASASQYAQRVFEIQETALEAVLHHFKGRDAADIATDRSVHEFLSEIEKQTPTADAMILVSDSGRVIASSRDFPAPDVDVSQRDYFKAHRNGGQGTYIGEVISTAPFGAIGFTISRRDPGTGIIAVADMPIDTSMRHSDLQVSQHDGLTLARADGMVLVTNLPLAYPIAFQMPEDWFQSRLMRGEFKAGTIAPATWDGVNRLWQFRKVGHYPVYEIYGLDAAVISAAWLHQIIPFGLLAFLGVALTYGLSRLWRTTQEHLATVVASSADAIISKTPDGIVTSWNEAAERMFGYPAGEMIGQSVRRLIPSDRQPEEDMILACLARGKRLEHYETVRVAKDGHTIDVSVTASPMRDATGRVIGASKIVRDITARKQGDAERQKFVSLADRSTEFIGMCDLGFKPFYVNEAGRRLVGLDSLEQACATPVQDFFFPEDRDYITNQFFPKVVGEGRAEVEIRFRHFKTGAALWMIYNVFEVNGEAGQLVGYATVSRDVTARKQAEEVVRRQADLLDQSHDAIFTWKIGGGIAYWSRGAERLYGYTAEEAMGRISHDLLQTRSPIPLPEVEAQIARDGSWYGELTHTMRDGRTIVVESRHVRVCYDGETYALETNRDVTDRRRAEEAQRHYLQRQTLLLKITSELICASELGELGRLTFEHIRPAFNADVCFNFRLDPVEKRLKRVFAHGVPQEDSEAIQTLELGQAYCGTVAASGEPVMADAQSIACQPNAALVRSFGIRAYACRPLKAADGRVLGTFSVGTKSRDRFTDEEVSWLGTVTNFLAQSWERFEAEARLAEREAQLALFVKYAPAAIAMFDDKMRYLAVSRRFISDYRLPAEAEIIGRSHYEILPDIPLRWREIHARVLAGEELSHEEDVFPRQDGHIDRVQWSMKPWRTADGRIGGALLFSQFMTRALAEKEARFQATFENAAVGIAHVAPDGRWLRVNEALCRILDYPADELITKSFLDVTYPDDFAVDLADRTRVLGGEIDKYAADKRFLRKDGSTVWIRLTVGCVRESEGSIDYLVCAVEDISARKHAEEQIRFLMREVNHRAKNLLGLVQAIARQTAAREPEDFVRLFSERLQALAANQDMLVRNEYRGIDAEELARAQLAHFADLVGSRIVLHGPRLRLNAAAAQAIGLALHELATNAGKYGALSVNAGRVDLQWRRKGDILAISWAERNGPPVLPPQRRGFGSTVVGSMVKLSVGGEVQLDYARSGLVWRLTCPAGNALEPGDREQTWRAGENGSGGGTGKVKDRLTA